MLKHFLTLCMIAVAFGAVTEEFKTSSINKHNEYRAAHGVLNLVYNASLSEFAQKYADKLGGGAAYVHNPESKANGFGENLSWFNNASKTGAQHVESLYTNEKAVYVWGKWCGTSEPNMAYYNYFGHYTQIVWKSTVSVGIGKSGGYVVYNYYPTGNIPGQFKENVPCPT
ncbi:Golgi-associated plant pathogenesis-related protein 1-like [Ruditapes philippinarum]|uniref:Golgi-associated plant pathogenesis-related protein 1-like n=1 Tax=Ruditapes philippinarum TaxID=129788 RepID=UPI00295BEEE5|nr:Golgi-associated plant pathogenesis-related protein 1-like [Ruditapes philippinarum]